MRSITPKPAAGLRREDKGPWERRAPIVPDAVRAIASAAQVRFVVQPSENRIFTDKHYQDAGADLSQELSGCKVVFGIKEIPPDKLIPGRVHAFFAHVIKGQPQNMAMLERMLDLGCTLIDYERIEDEEGRRLIFFGRHAGIAGMIDALWATGRRLALEGFPTPLSSVKRAYEYPSVESAFRSIARIGEALREQGIPGPLRPFVVGVAGYGNVSKGAQEVLDLLPVRSVPPGRAAGLESTSGEWDSALAKVVFEEQHMVQPSDPTRPFSLEEYYLHPERYVSCFEDHLGAITVLMNCIYWDERYPRLVTKAYLSKAFAGAARPRLRVIGDISCDVDGAVECTVRATTPGDPVFTYRPADAGIVEGLDAEGIVVLAVDNLPAELPLDASVAFSRMLSPFVPQILLADYNSGFEQLQLSPGIRQSVIVHRGELTPSYEYLTQHLKDRSP